MSNQTIGDLSKALREDLGWRRKEILMMQAMVRESTHARKQAILRGSIASLYAHWEGYVKNACRLYYSYVQRRRLNHNALAIPFLAVAIRRQLRSVNDSTRLDSHREFTQWLLSEWDRRAHLPHANDLFGTSNLSSHVFKAFIFGLGLPYSDDYAQAEKPIIDSLVEIRNQLAHGAWQEVEEDTYANYVIWITKLIEKLCSDIEDAAATSRYLRALTQLT